MKKRYRLIFSRIEHLSFLIEADSPEEAQRYYFAHELQMKPEDTWCSDKSYAITVAGEEDE